MKTGKITAKLRDAVPVCLMVEGAEVMRYKNIELPDMLKEVEMTDFHFNVHMDGKITFEIHYEPGVLPEVFPEARTRISRAAQKAAKTQREADPAEDAAIPAQAETALAIIPEAPVEPVAAEEPAKTAEEAMQEVSENRVMEIHYNATGPRRKELATAVGAFLEATPVYQKAPTYALAIGEYIIDREGTLIGAENHALTEALAEQDFTVA